MIARRPAGLTYFELLAVLGVITIMTALVIPLMTGQLDRARSTVTLTTMQEVREAINNEYYDELSHSLPFPADPGRAGHPQLAYLYVNPVTFNQTGGAGTLAWTYDPLTGQGWSGPYLTPGGLYAVDPERGFTELYGTGGDPAPLDGWGQPIVIQQPQPLGTLAAMRSREFTRLVSAGDNGVIDTPPDVPFPTTTETGDDLIVPLIVQP